MRCLFSPETQLSCSPLLLSREPQSSINVIPLQWLMHSPSCMLWLEKCRIYALLPIHMGGIKSYSLTLLWITFSARAQPPDSFELVPAGAYFKVDHYPLILAVCKTVRLWVRPLCSGFGGRFVSGFLPLKNFPTFQHSCRWHENLSWHTLLSPSWERAYQKFKHLLSICYYYVGLIVLFTLTI